MKEKEIIDKFVSRLLARLMEDEDMSIEMYARISYHKIRRIIKEEQKKLDK